MSAVDRVKDAGWGILGITFVVALTVGGILLLSGLAELSVFVLQWTLPVFAITFLIALALLVVSIIPPARGFCAVGLLIASMAFGAVLWIWGLSYTYMAWGLIGVIIGLVILGVGVVPVAMVAALINGDWTSLAIFCAAVVITFGSRGVASWLGEKADERTARLSRAKIDVMA